MERNHKSKTLLGTHIAADISKHAATFLQRCSDVKLFPGRPIYYEFSCGPFKFVMALYMSQSVFILTIFLTFFTLLVFNILKNGLAKRPSIMFLVKVIIICELSFISVIDQCLQKVPFCFCGDTPKSIIKTEMEWWSSLNATWHILHDQS